jgi:CRP/FNR family cyclic AMP-dependent transcriptional regulator
LRTAGEGNSESSAQILSCRQMPDHDHSSAPFIERLKESSLFGSLNENSLAFLWSRAKQIAYQAGAMVFAEGEPSQGLYWLQSGTLKAVKVSTRGKEQILHLIKPGQTFNEVGALSALPNPASVIVLVPAQVWYIPGNTIRQLIRQDPDFAQSIIDVLSKRLRDSAALVEDLSLRPVISRLSRLILDEADGDTLPRPSWYTQNELAARLGKSRRLPRPPLLFSRLC